MSTNKKRYSKYKDSGVEWIGEIPSHWEIKKLKYLAKIVTGNTPPKNNLDNYKQGIHLWIKPNELKGLSPTNDTQEKLSEIGQNLARIIPPYSVFMNGIGNIGEYGYSEKSTSTNQQINSVIYNEKIMKRFGIYLISTLKEVCLSNSQKVVVPILNKTKQENINAILPPLNEQKQIALFLDIKTKLIDSLIEKAKQKVELLKEYKQALISQCITKGLDLNVKMKDSRVEWIGDMPERWKVIKIKFLVRNVSEKKQPGKDDIKISPENVESDTGKCTDLYSEYMGEGLLFRKGDILLNKLRIYLKKIIYSKSVGYSMGEMIVLRVINNNVLEKHFYYTLFCQPLINHLDSLAYGIKLPRVSPEDILDSEISLPTLSEQVDIVKCLDEKTMIIDLLVEKIKRKIELLKDERTSMISNVVTGQINFMNNDYYSNNKVLPEWI